MSHTADLGYRTSAGAAAEPAVDLDTLLRSVLFVAVFLAAWISFHPYPDLSLPPQAVVEGGDLANQIGFSSLFLAFVAWAYRHEPRRLTLLLRPVLIALIAWCVLTVITSWEPSLAARRLDLRAHCHEHFGDGAAVAEESAALQRSVGGGGADRAGGLLFRRVLRAANTRSIRRPTFSNPNMPANWRGVFPHKNNAGATMVLFIFIGLLRGADA